MTSSQFFFSHLLLHFTQISPYLSYRQYKRINSIIDHETFLISTNTHLRYNDILFPRIPASSEAEVTAQELKKGFFGEVCKDLCSLSSPIAQQHTKGPEQLATVHFIHHSAFCEVKSYSISKACLVLLSTFIDMLIIYFSMCVISMPAFTNGLSYGSEFTIVVSIALRFLVLLVLQSLEIRP